MKFYYILRVKGSLLKGKPKWKTVGNFDNIQKIVDYLNTKTIIKDKQTIMYRKLKNGFQESDMYEIIKLAKVKTITQSKL